MLKSNLIWSVIVAVFAAMMVSCGGGVDYSDPKSVADAVIECYDNDDYETLKTLVDPADEYKLEELDKMARLVEENGGKQEKEPVVRTFKEVKEPYTGREISAESKNANVYYDSKTWPVTVSLKKVDGKWYFDRIK